MAEHFDVIIIGTGLREARSRTPSLAVLGGGRLGSDVAAAESGWNLFAFGGCQPPEEEARRVRLQPARAAIPTRLGT